MFLPTLSSPVSADRLQIATVTRFYYPPGDRRVSRFHVWLMSLDGRHRLRVDQGRDATGLLWLDRDHLAYADHERNGDSLWVLTLPTNRRRRIVTAHEILVSEYGIDIDGKSMRLSGIRLIPDRRPERSLRQDASIEKTSKSTFILWKGRRYSITNPGVRWRISMTADVDETIGLGDLFEPSEVRSTSIQGVPILRFDFSVSAHDELEVLIKLDPGKKTARIVPIDADDVRFDPQRLRSIALSNRRLESYGGLGLWTSSLFVGKIPSLKYRRLRLPFGYTICATLRP